MKKRILRVCAVLLCVLTVLASVRGAEAAGTVYFTAVNETVLELTDATMPFWHNGYMYVSTAMFAEKDLGVHYSYNTALQVLVLYGSEKALIFDLNSKKATDGQGVWQENILPAVSRNGRIFVPVYMVAEYFGLTYTSNQVALGYVVRLRSDKSVLDDHIFLDAATTIFEYRLEQYEQARKPVTERPGSHPGETETGEHTVCLTFRAGAETPALLDALKSAGAKAAFFFSGEQLKENAGILRRVMAEGHTVGLAADGEREEAVAEQLRQANDLLWRLSGRKTRLCTVDNGTAEKANEAKDAGYRVLNPNVTAADAADTAALYAKIRGVQGDAVVWLPGAVAPEQLTALLERLTGARAHLSAVTETTGIS